MLAEYWESVRFRRAVAAVVCLLLLVGGVIIIRSGNTEGKSVAASSTAPAPTPTSEETPESETPAPTGTPDPYQYPDGDKIKWTDEPSRPPQPNVGPETVLGEYVKDLLTSNASTGTPSPTSFRWVDPKAKASDLAAGPPKPSKSGKRISTSGKMITFDYVLEDNVYIVQAQLDEQYANASDSSSNEGVFLYVTLEPDSSGNPHVTSSKFVGEKK